MKTRRNVEPSTRVRGKTYYHGVHPDFAEALLESRELKPRASTGVKESGTRSWLEPRAGKVYLSPSVDMAWRYTDLAPGIGVVVAVDGNDLVDIEPDEDNVGALVYISGTGDYPRSSTSPPGFEDRAARVIWKGKWQTNDIHRSPFAEELLAIALPVLTKTQQDAMTGNGQRGDRVSMLAKVGKKVIPHLPDRLLKRIIQMGSNIAHEGAVPIIGAVACPPGTTRELRNAPGKDRGEVCADVFSSADYRAMKRKLMR